MTAQASTWLVSTIAELLAGKSGMEMVNPGNTIAEIGAIYYVTRTRPCADRLAHAYYLCCNVECKHAILCAGAPLVQLPSRCDTSEQPTGLDADAVINPSFVAREAKPLRKLARHRADKRIVQSVLPGPAGAHIHRLNFRSASGLRVRHVDYPPWQSRSRYESNPSAPIRYKEARSTTFI